MFFSVGDKRLLPNDSCLWGDIGSGNLTLNWGVATYSTFLRFNAAFPWAGADPITILLLVDSLERRSFGVDCSESTFVISVEIYLLGLKGRGMFLKLPDLSCSSNCFSTRVSLVGWRRVGFLPLYRNGGLLAGPAGDPPFLKSFK